MGFYAPSAQELALACGVSGAYVDVTNDLVTDSVKGQWGRTSAFSDTRPGVFSFDLVNDAGKYTPGNTSSTLARTVRVGMGVSHVVDGMHFAGTIRSAQPYFTGPASLAGSSKVRVTCDDLLGIAARTELNNLADDVVRRNSPYLWWPLDDSVGSPYARDITGLGAPLYPSGAGTTTFASPGISGAGPLTQVKLTTDAAGNSQTLRTNFGPSGGSIPTISYSSSATQAYWGVWITNEGVDNCNALLQISFANFPATSGNNAMTVGMSDGVVTFSGASDVYGSSFALGAPRHFMVEIHQETAAGTTSLKATPYVDGVAFAATQTVGSYSGAAATAAQMTPSLVGLFVSNAVASASFSNLTVTATKAEQYSALGTTEASRLAAIANAVPAVTLNVSAALSTAPLAPATAENQSALDAINDIVRTEQGSVYAETTGIVTAPTQQIVIRDRVRPTTATSFTISEVQNDLEFTTDLENMVSLAVAAGPLTSAVATDTTLIPYVASSSDSTSVLLRDGSDLLLWAQDRLKRGSDAGVRITAVTFDALAINRWADVSALRPGDRITITGLPSQLGVTAISGWILGCSYSLRYPALHGEDNMFFTFYMQPVLPATAIYDTGRYMAGGDLTLSASINSAVTSISVATTGATFTTAGGDLPLNIIIDSEEMTVTAASGATPQVLTVTRAQNGSTAAAHSAAATVELATSSLYAF